MPTVVMKHKSHERDGDRRGLKDAERLDVDSICDSTSFCGQVVVFTLLHGFASCVIITFLPIM